MNGWHAQRYKYLPSTAGEASQLKQQSLWHYIPCKNEHYTFFFKALNKNRHSDESQMISFTQKRNSFGLNNDYTDQGSTGHEERAIYQKRVLWPNKSRKHRVLSLLSYLRI